MKSMLLNRFKPGRLSLVDLGLLSLAALNWIALLSLTIVLATVSLAKAAEGGCKGHSLLPDLARTQPERYARMLEEAAKVPNGRGRLWKIEKPGTAPSYLFGTMHVTDPRVLAMPQAARDAIAAARTVVIESDEVLNERRASASIAERPDLMTFTDGSSLTDRLSPEQRINLEAGLQARGIKLATIAQFQPWIVSSFIAMPACEQMRKASGADFLDKAIAQKALANGKQVTGLETLVEQLTALSELPVEFHVQSLLQTLAIGDRMNDIMETMTALYLSGDIGMTAPMLKAVAPAASDGDQGYAGFEQRMITDRNHVMADRSEPILNEGAAFIAVGALHLPGPEGVIALLRAKGFSVTRIKG
ncbi:TraB/GumN family protein [Rhizobium halophytocola]|uniref:Uncharacterized protein YbaP (TraB family) n=1 Tax=Rhizobium halophytocola TaxID=735519 RepID=A0ABS4E2T4_9HYPH|nr:TraB/GumN family protein [Rhizobium halophytocola]MBP1852242.1 uncharacterized protein YbaP (TraB family) [Rhizobium halophytocola]